VDSTDAHSGAAALADVGIVPAAERYIDGFHAAVDAVARERRWLAFVEAAPVEQSRAFMRWLIGGGGFQFLAVDADDRVVGWCDIVRHDLEGFRHVGKLGMGLLAEYRGRGIGRRLCRAAIDAAFAAGIERVELEVFASNEAGIALYRGLGFTVEGVKRAARKIDGRVEDNVMMALFAGGARE
jgi:RimJ/RimL family protein N-acetyltransferase